MLFNVTGSGGNPINFRVVGGTTQPTSPKENTIWVKTAIDIPAVYLNKGPSPTWANSKGTVAISYEPIRGTGNITPTTPTLNLIKSGAGGIGGIFAMLNACYQNQDGTAAGWKPMEAFTYKSGQWVEWIVYYYNAGDECTDLTGGWESQAFRPAATEASTRRAGKPTVTKGDTSITLVGKAMVWDSSLSANVRHAGGLFTGAAVDLTGVDTLHLNVGTYSFESSTSSDLIGCFFGVTAEAKDYYTPAAQVRIEGTGLIDLDVSELTGAYYLYVSISYPGSTAPTIGFSEVYS